MKDLYFKGYITKISSEDIDAIPVVFKILFINTIPIAQEICTKKTFPLFYFQNIENFNIRTNFLADLFVIAPTDIEQKISFSLQGENLNQLLSEWEIFSFNRLTEDLSLNSNSYFDEEKFISSMSLDRYYLKNIEDKYKSNKTIYNSFPMVTEELIKLDKNKMIVCLEDSKDLYIDTKEIDNFGYNLSNQDNLCNLIGREEEIKKIIKTLCIRKTSALLVGDAGSGKTSIVEKLALDIKNDDNKWLKGKTIFYVNAASLESGTKYRGDFEEKLLKLINFSKEHKDKLILFIDEIHSLYGLGKSTETSSDAMNILKPYISGGDITIIGATTKEEYEKYMTTDKAFLRRFEKIDISLPDKKMLIDILLSYIDGLEKKYDIKLELDYDDKKRLINIIIELTDSKHQRIIGDVIITNPTLSKYILDDAFAEAIYNEKNIVTIDNICESIKACSKITPSTRKRIAEEINDEFNTNYVDEEGTNLIDFEQQKKLSTII